jgi:antitoxin YefM
MDTVFFSKARAELASLLDRVNADSAPIEIVRRDKPSAILISKDDYEAMAETLYLLSSPANAERLFRGRQDVDAGKYFTPEMPGLTDDG